MPGGNAGASVAASWVVTVADTLATFGFDAHAWLARHGAPPGVLRRTQERLPWIVPIRLWRAAARRIRDPQLGLHAAERVPTALRDSFVFLAMSSPTLRDLFGYYHRFQDLVATTRSLVMEPDGEDTAMVLRPGPHPPLTRHQVEFHLALWMRMCRFLAGDAFRPVRAELAHGAPAEGDAEHRRVFDCPVHFGQPRNALVLSRAALSLPSAYANSAVLEVLVGDADRRLLALEGAGIVARVQAVLATELPTGRVGLPDVAHRLGIAARTLQRQLAAEGIGFADVLDDARREAAFALVARNLTHAEIARLLGFAHVRSFRRAFQRWTSLTPQAYRQLALRRVG
jgi:AraC-like DNA-binding protein